ncbi:MAG: extracellular solute-binding protein [Lachnospiraceae bacterium]|nr:extracellular solute-binding protein [Lachnospiraceae bacterium]
MKKKILALALVLVMVAGLAACGSGSDSSDTTDTTAGENGSEAAEESGGHEYDSLSDEELYELALEEGGEITVYATTSKMLKAEEDFEAAYEGLDVTIMDLDQDEVLQKAQLEADSGNIYGDVLQAKDTNGSVYYEYFEDGILDEYFPEDICEYIEDDLLTYGYPLYTGAVTWYYNTEAYPDEQPVSSWWEIIETDEDGNQKYRLFTKEIGTESTYLALLTSFIVNADEMEQAYKDVYGEDLEYTYDDSAFDFEVPENNAGVEFLWRLSQCEMTFIGDGDELVAAVNNSTADDPALALASAGKITNVEESGYNIAWLQNLTPYTSMYNTENLYVVSDCPHPAGARLFIRWITGGTDAESGGLEYFKKEGNWPVRSDVEDTWNPVTIEELGCIAPDLESIYENYAYAQNMWTYWAG